MQDDHISRSGFIVAIATSIAILFVVSFGSYFNNKTRVVFCDVGQGDGSYIRTKDHIDIVVDAGPVGNRMLNCLGKYMPFYDRTIDVAFVSHPQLDHFGSFEEILHRYKIKTLVTTGVDNDTESFQNLKKALRARNVTIVNLYAGDVVHLGKTAIIKFLWPKKIFFSQNTTLVNGEYSANIDLNNFSEIFIFSDGLFDVLYTGDAGSDILDMLNKRSLSFSDGLDVLKFPHHGSKTALDPQFLKLADPTLTVISVAKKNHYGHPSREVLDLLRASKKRYLTTADHGDIIITVEKNAWTIKTSRP